MLEEAAGRERRCGRGMFREWCKMRARMVYGHTDQKYGYLCEDIHDMHCMDEAKKRSRWRGWERTEERKVKWNGVRSSSASNRKTPSVNSAHRDCDIGWLIVEHDGGQGFGSGKYSQASVRRTLRKVEWPRWETNQQDFPRGENAQITIVTMKQ